MGLSLRASPFYVYPHNAQANRIPRIARMIPRCKKKSECENQLGVRKFRKKFNKIINIAIRGNKPLRIAKKPEIRSRR